VATLLEQHVVRIIRQQVVERFGVVVLVVACGFGQRCGELLGGVGLGPVLQGPVGLVAYRDVVRRGGR